ncbi:unnamed protein product [Ilex paraguariensis]|uniref:Homogentisate phytyltransferase n=1 Tax=Ilex paraguariensis TaxID=185542 RepID=A0ABC8TMW2_9AQUA
MASLLGSFPKPLSSVSFPVTAELSSLTIGRNGWRGDNFRTCQFPYSHVAVQVSQCSTWNTQHKLYAMGIHQQHVMHRFGNVDERCPLYGKHSKTYLVHATSEHPLESEPEAYNPRSPLQFVPDALNAFYRFSRPHTVIGTALSILSVSLLAVEKLSDFSPLFFTGLIKAIVAALLMNIYIVGLNQLSDIEIDKVNKPYLPLASGEYSVATGVMIVSSFAVMSFWLGWIVGSWPLFWALSISFVLGTAYSINLPLLRWKRFAFVAAMCILAVRAVIVQIAFYLHMQTFVYGRSAVFSKPVIFATAFMSFFSVVIALFKDIPDIVGDRIYGIQSFTVRLGVLDLYIAA